MFHLAPQAALRLSPEAANVAEQFLRALPPFAREKLQDVRLFGPQARRFEPDEHFAFLVVADERSVEVKTALAIATSAAEADGLYAVDVTVATKGEVDDAPPSLARLLANARREGVELWRRRPAAG